MFNNDKITPKVSVILPTLNSSFYIHDAILSILNQSFQDFELIIIDDKSNDNTMEIVNSFEDKRIVKIITKKKLGLASCLNLGIKKSKSNLIARMDSDDVSESNRLEDQIKFLNKNKDIDIVGSAIRIIDNNGRVRKLISFPQTNLEIKWAMCLGCPIVHPSVIIRKDVFKKYGLYDKKEKIEDYSLWSRYINKGVQFHNLDKHLLKVRKHSKNLDKYKLKKVNKAEVEIIKRNIKNILNLKITNKNIFFLDVIRSNGKLKKKYIKEATQFLKNIFSNYSKLYLKSVNNKVLDSITKDFLEKIFIIRIRNLNNPIILKEFIVEIFLNFKFTIYLFFKVINNYFKK